MSAPQRIVRDAESDDIASTLWQQYESTRDPDVRERLILHFSPFARILAAKSYARRTHDDFAFEEYLQLAHVGMIEACDRFDRTRGAKFETFAGQRVLGAILNGLETLSEKQQQIVERKRLLKERRQALLEGIEQPKDGKRALAILAELAIGLAVGFALEDSGMYSSGQEKATDNAYRGVVLRQLADRLRSCIDTLPERERDVIRYHYLQQRPFDEIAAMFGLTKGRVSQLHKSALERLRALVTPQHFDIDG